MPLIIDMELLLTIPTQKLKYVWSKIVSVNLSYVTQTVFTVKGLSVAF